MIGWLMAFIFFVTVEVATCGIVSIWFAVGAFFAGVSTYYIDSFLTQLTIFAVVSAITLLATRPFVKKMKPRKTATNAESVIGKNAIVTKAITKDDYGQVKLNGQPWTATTDEDKILPETKVKVIAIEGVKLKVQSIAGGK